MSHLFFTVAYCCHIPIVMKNYKPSSALTLIMVLVWPEKAFNMYHQDTNKSTATDLVRVDYRIIWMYICCHIFFIVLKLKNTKCILKTTEKCFQSNATRASFCAKQIKWISAKRKRKKSHSTLYTLVYKKCLNWQPIN